MNKYIATEQDQKRAENIRRQYISREDNKIEQLHKLDNKVKAPRKMIANILGIIGALVLGAGMSLIMVWENMYMGLIVSIPGLVVTPLIDKKYDELYNLCEKAHSLLDNVGE